MDIKATLASQIYDQVRAAVRPERREGGGSRRRKRQQQ